MKKVVLCFAIIIVLFAVGVLAGSDDVKEDVKDFIKDKGIEVEVENITEIDFDDLPGELDIGKIDDTSIAIYQVDHNESKPLFVVTASNVKKTGSVAVADIRMPFVFGFAGEMSGSGFLKMVGGVEGSLDLGYVMMRSGSITGISSNLDIIDGVEGEIVEVVIYINGEEVGFRNVLNAGRSGVEIDYDSLSKGVVGFDAGDVVSVYVTFENGISLKDVTTVIEVTA